MAAYLGVDRPQRANYPTSAAYLPQPANATVLSGAVRDFLYSIANEDWKSKINSSFTNQLVTLSPGCNSQNLYQLSISFNSSTDLDLGNMIQIERLLMTPSTLTTIDGILLADLNAALKSQSVTLQARSSNFNSLQHAIATLHRVIPVLPFSVLFVLRTGRRRQCRFQGPEALRLDHCQQRPGQTRQEQQLEQPG